MEEHQERAIGITNKGRAGSNGEPYVDVSKHDGAKDDASRSQNDEVKRDKSNKLQHKRPHQPKLNEFLLNIWSIHELKSAKSPKHANESAVGKLSSKKKKI